MSSATPSRVHYFDKQFLRVDEFRDEQLYQLALRRRHNISQHIWGIVSGLELATEDGALVVKPGVAVDGYGRELLLQEKTSLAAQEFNDLGTDRLDVWLVYGRQDDGSSPEGYGECGSSGGTSYRSTETPQLLVERTLSNQIDARTPPGVSQEILTSPVPATSDDPKDAWRVYLGRIIRLEDQTISIDGSRRPYVGTRAQTIDHPANATRVEVGALANADATRTIGKVTYTYKKGDERRFAVFVPCDLDQAAAQNEVELLPRLDVVNDGTIGLHGQTIVNGNLQVSGGAIRFVDSADFTDDAAPEDPSIYRMEDKTSSKDELRVDLGIASVDRSFVIGFSADDGKFTECLRIKMQEVGGKQMPLVTIAGNLKIAGALQGKYVPQEISPEAQAALLGSFMAGVNASNNP